ncbi:MAG: hypothetical protein AAGD01_13645 [Acidobacteriota bacterium]
MSHFQSSAFAFRLGSFLLRRGQRRRDISTLGTLPALWLPGLGLRALGLGGSLSMAFFMALFMVLAMALLPSSAEATEVKLFSSESREDFLAGELEGVSVDRLGRLQLAPALERVAAVGEPFVFAADRWSPPGGGAGWVLGTGSSGRVVAVDTDGEQRVLLEAPESQVFAVLGEEDGTVYAGTSPGGKVYRILPSGESEVFFDSGEVYVWDLARAADGRLLVATGTSGKLFAVNADGEGELLFQAEDVHLRSLAVAEDGTVVLGTAGEGLILAVDAAGQARTLYDAPQPEIVALTPGDGDFWYAVAVASEASLVDLSSSSPAADAGGNGGSGAEAGGGDATLSFSGAGSRPSSFTGARSEVIRFDLGAGVESLASFDDETLYSLLWLNDRLWAGSGQQGGLYSIDGEGTVTLERGLADTQLVRLLAGARGLDVVSTNAAAVYRSTGVSERQGTFTSAVQDAGGRARFGAFHWLGKAPAGTEVAFAFRSGMSAIPDATWSPWSTAQKSSPGEGVDLNAVPAGRYVQWQAQFETRDEASPSLDRAELSYLQENQRPKVESLEVLEPGQILVPASFNPGQQAYERANPTRDGIFTTVESKPFSGQDRTKTVWKLGYRTLRWSATDPNGDELVYRLEVIPVDRLPEDDEALAPWLPVVKDLDAGYYSFDATVLPDGAYRFRLSASDRDANLADEVLSVQRITDPVVIDHAPPRLVKVSSSGDRQLEVQVEDQLNPLREAVVSVDAGPWTAVQAADGLVDERRESLVIPLPKDAGLVLLKLTDAAHNLVTLDLSNAAR